MYVHTSAILKRTAKEEQRLKKTFNNKIFVCIIVTQANTTALAISSAYIHFVRRLKHYAVILN